MNERTQTPKCARQGYLGLLGGVVRHGVESCEESVADYPDDQREDECDVAAALRRASEKEKKSE